MKAYPFCPACFQAGQFAFLWGGFGVRVENCFCVCSVKSDTARCELDFRIVRGDDSAPRKISADFHGRTQFAPTRFVHHRWGCANFDLARAGVETRPYGVVLRRWFVQTVGNNLCVVPQISSDFCGRFVKRPYGVCASLLGCADFVR